MKISKASWMILAAGVFIILLAGMAVARLGQMKEQEKLKTDLAVSVTRLEKLQVASLQAQLNELQAQLKDAGERAEEAKAKLVQTVISVDVAEKFYEIADYYGVIVNNLTTTPIDETKYQGIVCETISVAGEVEGELADMVDFVLGLNDNFQTGYVRSLQLSNDESKTTVQMIVYTRKGS